MAKQAPPTIPADERDQVSTPDQVRERVNEFVTRTFGSWYAFEEAARVPHATAAAWKTGGGLGLDSMLKLAEQGLSLDWLVTGHGPMKRRIGTTDVGELLERMLPYLQRAAGVGQFTATQALSMIALRLGQEGALEKAAQGLQADFNQVIADAAAVQTHAGLMQWAHAHLTALEQAAKAGNSLATAQLLADWRERMTDHLPPDFRPCRFSKCCHLFSLNAVTLG